MSTMVSFHSFVMDRFSCDHLIPARKWTFHQTLMFRLLCNDYVCILKCYLSTLLLSVYYFLGIAVAMKNVTHLVTTDTVDHTNVAK